MTVRLEYASPLGPLTMTSDGVSLTGLRFGRPEDGAPADPALPVLRETVRWLDLYFSGRDPGFTPRLDPGGEGFRREIWDLLLSVPFGHTVTYGELAARIAERRNLPRMSAQAVGGAAGRNPIALVIPCHRLVGTGGRLTGYAAGIEKKAWLLAMEKAGGMPQPPR